MLFAFLLFVPSAFAQDAPSRYEAQLRQELHDLLGMPLDPARKWQGRVIDREEADGENRVRYIQVFRTTEKDDPNWNGSVETQTGKLIYGEWNIDMSWVAHPSGIKNVKADAHDPRWEEIAKACVFSARTDDASGIVSIVNLGESRANEFSGVSFRLDTEDGTYTVQIIYALDKAVRVVYRDARAQRQFEEHQMKMGIINE